MLVARTFSTWERLAQITSLLTWAGQGCALSPFCRSWWRPQSYLSMLRRRRQSRSRRRGSPQLARCQTEPAAGASGHCSGGALERYCCRSPSRSCGSSMSLTEPGRTRPSQLPLCRSARRMLRLRWFPPLIRPRRRRPCRRGRRRRRSSSSYCSSSSCRSRTWTSTFHRTSAFRRRCRLRRSRIRHSRRSSWGILRLNHCGCRSCRSRTWTSTYRLTSAFRRRCRLRRSICRSRRSSWGILRLGCSSRRRARAWRGGGRAHARSGGSGR